MGPVLRRMAGLCAYSLLVVALVSVVALAVAAGALQTRAGKDRLARLIETVVSKPGEITLTLGELDGRLPLSARVSELALADGDGTWLEASDVELDVRWPDLLGGTIRLTLVRAGTLVVHRLPVDDDDESSDFRPGIVVEECAVSDLRLGQALLGDWSAGPLRAEAEGRLDLAARAIDARFRFEAADLADATPASLGLSAVPAVVSVAVSGSFAAPELDVNAAVGELTSGWASADRVRARLHAAPVAQDAARSPEAYDVRLGITVDAPAPGDRIVQASGEAFGEALEGMLGGRMGVEAVGRVSLADRSVRVDRLSVESAGVVASASGSVRDGRLDVPRLRVELPDLGLLAAGAARPSAGRVEITGSVVGDVRAPDLTGELAADASGLVFAEERLAAMLGGAGDGGLSLAFALDRQRRLRLDDITLSSALVTAGGDGLVDLAERTFDAELELLAPDLAPVSTLVGVDLAGAAAASIDVGGGFDGFELTAALEADHLRVAAGEPIASRVAVAVEGLPRQASGVVDLVLVAGDDVGNAHAAFTLAERELQLREVLARGAGVSLRGDARLDLDSRTVGGRLLAEVADLAAATALIGWQGSGRLSIDATASADGGEQALAASLRASGVTLRVDDQEVAAMERLEADLELADVLGAPSGSVHVLTAGVRSGRGSIASLEVSAAAQSAVWRVRARSAGHYGEPFVVTTDLTAHRDERGWTVDIDEVAGALAGEAFSTTGPVRVASEGDTFHVDSLQVDVGDGRIEGAWHARPEALEGRLALSRLPLRMIRLYDPALELAGHVSGELFATGTPQDPAYELSVAAERVVAVGHYESDEVPPLSGRLVAVADRRAARASLQLDDGRAGGMNVEASIPLAATTDPAPDDEESLSVSVVGAIDLAALDGVLNVGENRIGGRLRSDLTMTGTPEQPWLDGDLWVEDGVYENATIGVGLQGLTARVRGQGDRLVLSELSAGDGDGGRLGARGVVDMADGVGDARYELAVDFDSLWVVRLDEAEVRAHGDLRVTGEGEAVEVVGTIEAAGAELRAGTRLPPEVVVLDVVETNTSYRRDRVMVTDPRHRSIPIAFDVTLSLPARVFFRAPDLNSEWRGELHVGGTNEEPRLEGRLKLVRGTFNALGVRFTPTEGSLRFDGGADVDPTVNLVAEASRHDIVARVHVRGRASNLTMELTSDPVLPTDEIASRLLFGESASDLSPAQTVQLAAAVARLSSGGPGPMDWFRRRLGVDRITVESGGEGVEGSVVSVGKYVGNGVFVSIDQGLEESSSKATVEVELTRQLSVETEVGVDAEGRLGIRWRHRY